MKIYIDLLLLQNIFVTFLILLISDKVLNLNIKIVRMLIVSIVVSVLTIVFMIFFPKLSESFALKVLMLFFMIRFGLNVKENILEKCLALFMVTLIFGGIGALAKGKFVDMLFCFSGVTILIFKMVKRKKDVLLLSSATCYITFEYNLKKYRLRALVDTGNRVKTYLNEDVIFIKSNLLKMDGGEYKRARNVSYQTVAGRCNNKGIRVNNIFVKYGDKKIRNNAVIVSTPNISKDFDAIVSLNFVEGGWQDGNINFDETKSKKVIS